MILMASPLHNNLRSTLLLLVFSPYLLVGCVTPAAIEEVPLKQVLAIDQSQSARSVFFSKLVLDLARGSKYGVTKLWFFCLPTSNLYWGDNPIVMAESDVRNAFNQMLAKGKYTVIGRPEALFEDPSKAELIVAGLVKEMRINLCTEGGGMGGPGFVTGESYIEVQWQVYSRAEGKVVYETKTEGSFKDKASGNGARPLIIGAFSNATHNLLADMGFHTLVTRRHLQPGTS